MMKDTKKTLTNFTVSNPEAVVQPELKYTKAAWDAVG